MLCHSVRVAMAPVVMMMVMRVSGLVIPSCCIVSPVIPPRSHSPPRMCTCSSGILAELPLSHAFWEEALVGSTNLIIITSKRISRSHRAPERAFSLTY